MKQPAGLMSLIVPVSRTSASTGLIFAATRHGVRAKRRFPVVVLAADRLEFPDVGVLLAITIFRHPS